jgi:hypothetical protein
MALDIATVQYVGTLSCTGTSCVGRYVPFLTIYGTHKSRPKPKRRRSLRQRQLSKSTPIHVVEPHTFTYIKNNLVGVLHPIQPPVADEVVLPGVDILEGKELALRTSQLSHRRSIVLGAGFFSLNRSTFSL